MTTLMLFDAADIDYLVRHFTLPGLRRELHAAEAHKSVARQFGESDNETFFDEFVDITRLAINVHRWCESGPRKATPGGPRQRIDVAGLKSQIDLVEVASRYTELHKAGRNFKGLCPLHNEKTPSFVVYPEQQTWHCFGCQAHGDVISFVQATGHVDFKSAVSVLGGGR